MDFLRFCVWVNGESVEENANLVIRLLIRRPECLGPALRGEGEGLKSAVMSGERPHFYTNIRLRIRETVQKPHEISNRQERRNPTAIFPTFSKSNTIPTMYLTMLYFNCRNLHVLYFFSGVACRTIIGPGKTKKLQRTRRIMLGRLQA